MHITLDRIKITSVMFLTLHKISEFYFGPKDRKIHNQFMSSIYHAHFQPPFLPGYFLFICAFSHLFIIQQIQLLSAHYYGIWSSNDSSVFFVNCDLNFFIIIFVSLQCFSWFDDRPTGVAEQQIF